MWQVLVSLVDSRSTSRLQRRESNERPERRPHRTGLQKEGAHLPERMHACFGPDNEWLVTARLGHWDAHRGVGGGKVAG